MARDENALFGRGETAGVTAATDQDDLVGQVRVFEDLDYSQSGVKPRRTNHFVKCMAVRNLAAAAVIGKRLGLIAWVSGKPTIAGYATTTAVANAYPIDEFLPSGGCAVNDICWVVIEGPAVVLTPLSGDGANVFAVGDALVSLTAATSGSTTSGRVKVQDLTGATAILGAEVGNRLGFALTAKTTANTNADLLVNVKRW